jgi:hypothetical protein
VLLDNELVSDKCAELLLKSLEIGYYRSLFEWFTQPSLVDWKKVSALEKLKIITGIVPDISVDYKLDLIKFPLSDLSNEAFLSSERSCSEETCKKSFPVLFRFKDFLSREQLVTLGTLLLAGTNQTRNFLMAWFKLKPKVELVLELVLARDLEGDKDNFTEVAMAYLLTNDFGLNTEQKIKLCSHPETRLRRLCIIKLEAKEDADRKILEKMLQFEKDLENRKLLRQKLAIKG